jgi:transposase-like protein
MLPTTPAHDQYTHCSCPNPACARFTRPEEGNIAQRSWTGTHQPIERLRCTVCRREFSTREGTLRARSQVPEETVERLLNCQRWGGGADGTADICGVDRKTVHRFQRVAAPRAQAHHAQVTRDLEVKGVHVDARHSKRRGPRVEWRHTAIAMRRRVLLWVHWGPRTQERAALLIAPVVARRWRVPVGLSAGWTADPAALVQVLGLGYQRCRRGTRGRHPKPRVGPPRELFYGQVVQVREATGHLLHVVSRVVDGGPRRFFRERERRRLGATIHTACMERWYGTLRGLCAPLRRRTRCGSSRPSRHHARVWLLVDLDNGVLPPKSLRQQGQPRTPALVIGLAAHVWSDRDYLWYPVHPDPLGRQLMQQRVKARLIPALQAG